MFKYGHKHAIGMCVVSITNVVGACDTTTGNVCDDNQSNLAPKRLTASRLDQLKYWMVLFFIRHLPVSTVYPTSTLY